MKFIIILTLALVSLTGCMSASQHRSAVQDDSGEKLTVGVVQKEIKVGMSGAGVLEVLGSPNIVSTDEQRREVWVYDKIATDVVYSNSGGGAMILGFASNVLLGGGGSYNKNAGAASTSQRTLTIIIKFDDDSKVRDFAYHSSSF
jgi:outer membrane protein assembly factor BamE (lipoprotein component of BamABCDE complex)